MNPTALEAKRRAAVHNYNREPSPKNCQRFPFINQLVAGTHVQGYPSVNSLYKKATGAV